MNNSYLPYRVCNVCLHTNWTWNKLVSAGEGREGEGSSERFITHTLLNNLPLSCCQTVCMWQISLLAWLFLNETMGSEIQRSFKRALMLLSHNTVLLFAIHLSLNHSLAPNPQLKHSPRTSPHPLSTSWFTHYKYSATTLAMVISSRSNSLQFFVSCEPDFMASWHETIMFFSSSN